MSTKVFFRTKGEQLKELVAIELTVIVLNFNLFGFLLHNLVVKGTTHSEAY